MHLPWLDITLAVVIGAAVLLLHNVSYILHHSFWLDEAWVADSTRARIGLLPWITSSTPLGWTLLLRAVPGPGQTMRLIPLAFTGLAAAAGYWLGREIRLNRYLSGLMLGAAVLLSPAMLLRDDLKQYTTEAFASIVILVLVARLENRWRKRDLAIIAVFTGLGLLFTNTVTFVGVAAMVGLACEALLFKRWRRLLQIGMASIVMCILSLVVYLLIDARHQNASLHQYWAPFFAPRTRGISGLLDFWSQGFVHLAPFMGVQSLALDATAAAAGVIALIYLRRYALAIVMPLTIILVLFASAAQRYPFGDSRTSTFWLVFVPILTTIAVLTAARLVSKRYHLLQVGMVASLLVFLLAASHSEIRSSHIGLSMDDVGEQVAYLDAHRVHGDVVVLSSTARFGFAYYERDVPPSFQLDKYSATGFVPLFPTARWIVPANGSSAYDITQTLIRARSLINAEPGRHTIWIIRSVVTVREADIWTKLLAGKSVMSVHVGSGLPLLSYHPG